MYICTVQLNANLMTVRGLQVENTQVNLHTHAGKDQGDRQRFFIYRPTCGCEVMAPVCYKLLYNALILTIALAASDVISFIHSSLKNPRN